MLRDYSPWGTKPEQIRLFYISLESCRWNSSHKLENFKWHPVKSELSSVLFPNLSRIAFLSPSTPHLPKHRLQTD